MWGIVPNYDLLERIQISSKCSFFYVLYKYIKKYHYTSSIVIFIYGKISFYGKKLPYIHSLTVFVFDLVKGTKAGIAE